MKLADMRHSKCRARKGVPVRIRAELLYYFMLHPKIALERSLIDFDPKVVFEIGVGPVELSRSRLFWQTSECHLFEPLEEFQLGLWEAVDEFPNVHLHEVAIWKENGQVELVTGGETSFIAGVDSPANQWDRRHKPSPERFIENDRGEFMVQGPSRIVRTSVLVQADTIDIYDQGNIDVLWLDTEGAEYHVLEKLISRPRFISVECKAKMWYTNPHLQEIKDWMNREGYEEAGSDDADIYFKRRT